MKVVELSSESWTAYCFPIMPPLLTAQRILVNILCKEQFCMSYGTCFLKSLLGKAVWNIHHIACKLVTIDSVGPKQPWAKQHLHGHQCCWQLLKRYAAATAWSLSCRWNMHFGCRVTGERPKSEAFSKTSAVPWSSMTWRSSSWNRCATPHWYSSCFHCVQNIKKDWTPGSDMAPQQHPVISFVSFSAASDRELQSLHIHAHSVQTVVLVGLPSYWCIAKDCVDLNRCFLNPNKA